MPTILRPTAYRMQVLNGFLDALHQEKIHTQRERTDYVRAKLVFVSALFGLGSIRTADVTYSLLLYIIPFIAIGYDLYIHAADKSIKKIGEFLGNDAPSSKAERLWEDISSKSRDRTARITNTLFSFLITLAAAFCLFKIHGMAFYKPNIPFFLWAFFFLVFIDLQGLYQLKTIDDIDKGKHKSSTQSSFWNYLKDIVKSFFE